MAGGDDPWDDAHESGSWPAERPTEPATPGATRRSTVPPRVGWGFEREPDTGKLTAVKVLCTGCLREFRMCPPRFSVSEDGEVLAKDEGAAFRCTTCDQPIGPLRLAAWSLGRL